MPIYFLPVGAQLLEQEIVPALAAAWRQRSFVPCRPLCSALLAQATAFAQTFRTGTVEPFLGLATRALPFDRHVWQHLAGELLLIAAAEIPEFQTCPDTLCCILAPQRYEEAETPRDRFAPIQQAHYGSRDLRISSRVYRPEHAGYNNAADVARLAEYLGAQDPALWTVDALRLLRATGNEEDRRDELGFAREWFPALRELYDRARQRQQAVVCEII